MAFIFTKNRLSKAVLICTGQSDGLLNSLIKDNPSYMLPVLNRPLIEHTIEFLKSHGIKSISVTVPKSAGLNIEEFSGNLMQTMDNGVEINCIEEEKPAGSAGILRGLKGISGDESFIVIGGNIFIQDIDLDEVFAEHVNRKSMLTVGIVKKKGFPTDGIAIEKDFSVKAFSAIHPSRERRSQYSPLDFYVFDAKALKYIKDSGYFDIKEQLVPALKASGAHVYATELKGAVRAINTVEDYFEAHRDALVNGDFSKGRLVEVSENV
ncbi:MAG: NDP-sugar synthase, partial [Deltaproteobacteria bacterium]